MRLLYGDLVRFRGDYDSLLPLGRVIFVTLFYNSIYPKGVYGSS